jgi:hypothetical protein
VIFGATGDLTKRLVVPALYNLARTKVLPEKFALIGVARSVGTVEHWRNHLYDILKSFVGNTATEFDVDHIDEDTWKQRAEPLPRGRHRAEKSQCSAISCATGKSGDLPSGSRRTDTHSICF